MNIGNRLLAMDVESGGIGVDYSLLSLSMKAFDYADQGNASELNLLLRPDPNERGESAYHVTAKALSVNKINLIEHDAVATPYRESKKGIYDYLSGARASGEKLIVVGHHVAGDIRSVLHYTISQAAWSMFVDTRVIDTLQLAQTLRVMGKIPNDISLALGSLAKYFEIEIDPEKLHTASYDVEVNIAVFYKLVELMKVNIESNLE